MRFPALVRPCTIWVPTLTGWALLFVLLFAPAGWWLWRGERVLAADIPAPPEVLVIDGWIKEEPILAAGEIFLKDCFRLAVAAGGYEGEKWARRRPSFAEFARECLEKAGVPAARIVLAQAPDSSSHRTFAVAVAARDALTQKGSVPRAVTVFTRGTHAWRTQMVYRKVFGPAVQVGVIAWKPPEFESEAWWRNSSRAEEFLKETIGCLWEALFDSGRTSR